MKINDRYTRIALLTVLILLQYKTPVVLQVLKTNIIISQLFEVNVEGEFFENCGRMSLLKLAGDDDITAGCGT